MTVYFCIKYTEVEGRAYHGLTKAHSRILGNLRSITFTCIQMPQTHYYIFKIHKIHQGSLYI